MNKTPFSDKKIGLLIVVLVVIVSGIGFFVLHSENGANAIPVQQQPVRPVKVMELSETTHSEIRTFPGVVQATREVDLAFRVGGPLVEMNIRIGQHIKKGEVLARIDDRDFKVNRMRLSAALSEAHAGLKAMKSGARPEDIASLEAQFKAVQARMEDAKSNYERQKQLLERNVTTQAAYDNALAAYDTAMANVDVVQQELKKARSGARIEDIQAAEAGIKRLQADFRATENALKDTRLVAPFSGYVGSKHVENFENVDSGEVIVSLLDFSSVEVRAAIPEDLVIRQKEIVDASCTLDAYTGHTFPATIKEIGRKTDKANQSYPLTVSLTLDQGLLPRPGMAATLMLKLKKTENPDARFLVPSSAVFADPEGLPCVWRVDMHTLRVVKTRVSTGKLYHNTIHITSGLSSGDRVVIAGARFLQDNQKIRILNQKMGDAI